MPLEVIMPALGMAQDTGLIVSWHKSQGDSVAEGDVLFEVETDKATMEVEAQGAGFLSDVRAGAGDEVPVGNVIAMISDSADEGASASAPAKAETSAPAATADADDALPEGEAVIMPALGMAQDTGHIVAWHKAAGDAVKADDVLFEVETDKATMDVEAGHDGFVAALLAEAGEDAPVGEPIAIISPEKPDTPVQRSRKGGAPAPSPKADASAEKAAPPAKSAAKSDSAPAKAAPKPAAKAPAAASADGRILASPKARRLALEQGLDLNRLVTEGHPQPYHVADIEVLKALPSEAAQATHGAQAASRHLTATIETEGFTAFAAWAVSEAGIADAQVVLAGLAGASLEVVPATVAVESFGTTRLFDVPDGPFGAIAEADPEASPDIILRDLRMSHVQGVTLGAEAAPVLTLTKNGAGLSITLECGSHHLGATQAVALLSNFAGRIELPLRHLL